MSKLDAMGWEVRERFAALEDALVAVRDATSWSARGRAQTEASLALHRVIRAVSAERPVARKHHKSPRSTNNIINDLVKDDWIQITYDQSVIDKLVALASRRALYSARRRTQFQGNVTDWYAPRYLVLAAKEGASVEELKKIMRSASKRKALTFAAHAQE
jgi:hypothetical protein